MKPEEEHTMSKTAAGFLLVIMCLAVTYIIDMAAAIATGRSVFKHHFNSHEEL